MKKIFLLFITTGALLTSCLKENSFPDEPQITFKSFLTYGDSARLTVGFTDGDGNFGLNQEDTLDPFCGDSCIYHWNVFCEYYELQNGTWVHFPMNPLKPEYDVAFYYRTPYVLPTGQNKAQDGEISILMSSGGLYSYYLESDYDTCRFEIHIVDRDLNTSNTITTSAFLKP